MEGQDQPVRFSTCTSSHRYTNKHLKRFLCLNAAWCCAALEWALYLCFTPFHLGNCTSKGRLLAFEMAHSVWGERCLPGRLWVEALWNVSRTTGGESYKQQSERFLVDKKKLKGLYSVWVFQTVTFPRVLSLHPRETLYMKPYGRRSSLLKHHHFHLSFSPTFLFSFHSSINIHMWLLGPAV